MAFTDDRDALVALVKANSCHIATEIAATGDYPDLIRFLFEEAGLFDCDTAYLEACLAIFDDSILVANNIYYNKTDTTVSDPIAVIKCTYDQVYIGTSGDFRKLEIMDNSVIGQILVDSDTQIFTLIIGGGSYVDLLTVTDDGSCIEGVVVKACSPNVSTLNKVDVDSCVNEVVTDPGAIFNGYDCNPAAL